MSNQNLIYHCGALDKDTLSTYELKDDPFLEESKMIVPTKEEFRKMSSEKQTQELFNLIQKLLPLNKRMDSLTDSVSTLAERMNGLESKGKHFSDHPEGSNHDSDSMYKSLTSLGGAPREETAAQNIPDPFIIKRSKEINRYDSNVFIQ